MKFKAWIDTIEFEAKDEEEANEIISEVMVDANFKCSYVENMENGENFIPESTLLTGKYRCMKCDGEDVSVHGLYCKEKGDAK